MKSQKQNRFSQFAKNCLKMTALLVWGAAGMVWAKERFYEDHIDVSQLEPYDGERIFEGEIIEETCEVDIARSDHLVNLPPVSTSALRQEGDTAGDTKFSIILKGCRIRDYNRVQLAWTGLSHDSLLFNALAFLDPLNAAGNVWLKVIKSDGYGLKRIELGEKKVNIDSEKAPDSGVGNIQPRFDYIVKYYATGQATPGNVQAAATFEITYE